MINIKLIILCNIFSILYINYLIIEYQEKVNFEYHITLVCGCDETEYRILPPEMSAPGLIG